MPVSDKAPAKRSGRSKPGVLEILAIGSLSVGLVAPASAQPAAPPSIAPRFVPPDPAELSEPMRRVYEASVKNLGGPIGPRMAMIRSPEVAQEWAELLTALGGGGLSKRSWELAILVVARAWDSPFEWWAHEGLARKEGVPTEVVEAIRLGREPTFTSRDDETIYRYTRELLADRKVSDNSFQATKALLGDRSLIDLTVLVGYYSAVAMVLKAYEINVPAGAEASLPLVSDARPKVVTAAPSAPSP